jgi:uncharacterized protein (TIGR00266 family)
MTEKQSHEIDYTIHGQDMQLVEVTLDPQEAVVAEAGAMAFMDDGIIMETMFGDGSAQRKGVLGAITGAGARLLSGEKLFMTRFTNESEDRKTVGFAAPHPGSILALDLAQLGGAVLAQKEAFLCAAYGTSLSVGFQKKLSSGFFGGEGFILQKVAGDGLAFLHAGGVILEKTLQEGQVLRVDTGCLVAMQGGLRYEVEMIKGVKSLLFGGEGLFNTVITGPGKVWVQSLPYGRVVDMIVESALKQLPENAK